MKPRRNEEREGKLVAGGRWSVVGTRQRNPRNAKPKTRNSLSLRVLRALRGVNLLLLLGCLAPLPLGAHGVTSEHLKQITEQIQRAPHNADLYLRRGELHRKRGNAKAALEDFDKAQKLAPERLEVDLYRARLHLDANVPELAQLVLDRYLKRRPQHTEAVLLRAQANTQLGARAQAIQDYTTALARLTQPKPELFLARAQLQIETKQLDAAINGLDEGLAKLGALVTLQSLAMDVEVKRKRWDAALTRLETIAAQSPRQERWLVQRAEILLQAGRRGEAEQALAAARRAIAALPEHLRRTAANTALEARATALLHTFSLSDSAPMK